MLIRTKQVFHTRSDGQIEAAFAATTKTPIASSSPVSPPITMKLVDWRKNSMRGCGQCLQQTEINGAARKGGAFVRRTKE